MRVLVAGGAGFIGATLCARLLDRGDEVVCVDNLITGSADNVKPLARPRRASLSSRPTSAAAVPVDGPFDAVVNLACPASPADFGPLALEILDVGSRGVANLLDLARRDGRPLPAGVHQRGVRRTRSSTRNRRPTGATSTRSGPGRSTTRPSASARPSPWPTIARTGSRSASPGSSTPTAPACAPTTAGWSRNFVTQALRGEPLTVYGDGSQTSSFCYVDDLVTGLLALLDSAYTGPVNLGTDDERTVLEVAQLVLEVSGSTSGIVFRPRPVDDPVAASPRSHPGPSGAGLGADDAAADGLARTIEWFRTRIAGERSP